MLRLKRYLKPFILALLLAFALLFIQAISDLNLPNYMSNIVNVGIQQNGIESGVPEFISEEGLQFIGAFVGDELSESISSKYEAKDGHYVTRGDLTSEERAALETDLQNVFTAMVLSARTFASQSGEAVGSANSTDATIDMAALYKYTPMLSLIPEQQKQAMLEEAMNTSESMKKQYAIAMVEGFYREMDIDIAGIQRGYILNVGWQMMLIALVAGIATVLVNLISSRIAAGVSRALRRDVFAKVERFSNAEINKFGSASLITRTTNDITQIQMFIQMGVRMLLYAPIMCVGGILMALRKSASMSWIIAVAGVFLIGMMLIILSIVLPRFKIMQKLVDKLNLVSRENLSGLMVIRAFGTGAHEAGRFDEANKNLTNVNLFVNRVMSVVPSLMTLLMSGISLLTVWVGAHQIAASTMQVGDMMAFMQYSMQIIMSFVFLTMMFVFIPRAQVSAGRIADVLETVPSILDPDQPRSFVESEKGVVEFRNVSFRYEGAEEDALQNIDFCARPGQTTAIIGATGSGKSTIASLIMRFFDATKGNVMVGGVDVRELRQRDLRSKIGYIPQKGVLLSGTIRSNINYGKPESTDEQTRKAAEVAQALDFIEAKPRQFDDEIAQGGDNVSGGQKQRLSIARALAINPDIFIFDDSFSALDYKTDVTLRAALKKHTGDSTILIVAQRISTILHADQILVLDEGRLVGKGTHAELMKSCPEYMEIAYSQLSEEELA